MGIWRNREYANELWALGADDGKLRWKHSFPVWRRGSAMGDEESYAYRHRFCLPSGLSNPTLDASGRIYVGNVDGVLYVLADRDGDNIAEVEETYDAQSAFIVSGAAIAPGMMGISSCNSLLVFQ